MYNFPFSVYQQGLIFPIWDPNDFFTNTVDLFQGMNPMDIPDPIEIKLPEEISSSNLYTPFLSENLRHNNLEAASFQDIINWTGLPARITSSKRYPGLAGKIGNASWHTKTDEYGNSLAYDIVPTQGSFALLKLEMLSNPVVVNWMLAHNFGLLEETTPSVMAKTGATGPHFHIGRDSKIDRSFYSRLDNYLSSKGYEKFNRIYDKMEKENSDFKLYREFLTKTAFKESSFVSDVKGFNGALGYFLLMPFNIKPFSGVSYTEYRYNPEILLLAALNLINYFKKNFTQRDYSLAKKKGYTENAMLAACWLGGLGGMRAALERGENRKDSNGTSVLSRMKQFNF